MTSELFYDSHGVYGNILHYALAVVFMGSALLLFIYFWAKGRLDMDEEAKYEMLQENEEKE